MKWQAVAGAKEKEVIINSLGFFLFFLLNLRAKTRTYFMFSVQKLHPFFRGSTTEQEHSEKKMFPEWCSHLSLQKGKRRSYLRAFCAGNKRRKTLSVVNCKAY